MNKQLTLGEYISRVFFKETGQGKAELAVNMGLTLEQVSLLLEDKLELSSDSILSLSRILPISLAEIHSRLLLTYQHQSTLQVMCHNERDKILLEYQIKHTLNSATNNMCLCEPLTILQLLNDNITVAYLKFGHSISFDVFLKGNVIHITTQYSVKNSYSRAKQFTSMFTTTRYHAEGLLVANRNKQQDMKMNKTDTKIKAFLDEMGDLLSDDQKKEIQEHIERHERAKLIKDAKKTLDNAMKAMHLSKNEEAKRSAKVQYFDAFLGDINNRLDASLTNLKDLVEKRREEELVKSISKVKALIKKDTITINKLTDKRVNLTANLFNLEDKLTKLRNSNKSK